MISQTSYLHNIVKQHLNIEDSSVVKIDPLGGMTNKNYLVTVDGHKKYVLRMPGCKTESLINREYEALNSLLASEYEFNAKTYVLDCVSGIKITQFLDNSYTFNHQSIKSAKYLQLIADKMRKLHNSSMQFSNEFNVFSEFDKYLSLLKNKDLLFNFSPKITQLITFFYQLKNILKTTNLAPCHNDLVPENILLKDNIIYLIDWEYSGMNNPLFDIAAFCLEARLEPIEKELFLSYYFQNNIPENIDYKLTCYQFTQDILWFLWTLVKAENHEYFGDYAEKRLDRAISLMAKLASQKG